MAFKNFIPTVWGKTIERDLNRLCVFKENCNMKYQGNVSARGDSVRILGVAKPTITRTNDRNIVLDGPEQVEESSVTMMIDQIAYFDYMIDDIDKQMAEKGIMAALSQETSEGLANEVDRSIANLALDKSVILHSKEPIKIDENNVMDEFNEAIKMLYKNDVKQNEKITATISPDFYFFLKKAYERLDTDNSALLKNGVVGRYGNVVIKMSNNVANENGADKIMLRTDRAIAFAQPMTHTEAYRVEKGFSDAVKGFILFGQKIVRPKEMIVLNTKYI